MDPKQEKMSGPTTHSVCDAATRGKLKGLNLVKCVQTAVTAKLEDKEKDYDAVPGVSFSLEDTNTEAFEINLAVSEKMACSFCEVEFSDRQEQVRHYKSDFHHFNLKQRLRGAPPLTEESFEDIADDISSSISGSDLTSESEDSDTDQDVKKCTLPVPTATDGQPDPMDGQTDTSALSSGRTPHVYFTNDEGELLSIYRCVLHGKKNIPENDEDIVQLAQNVTVNAYWAILMVGGGHFAAAVYNRDEMTAHKTFHRYTVRAKRGTAQGMRDGQGNAPKSAGASLRRYNEASLIQETQDLLQSWSEEIKKCSVVFLRAPSYNRALFFGNKNPPFDKNDPRVRMIPFATRRPTLKEVKRVHGVLSSVINYGPVKDVDVELLKSPSKQKRAAHKKNKDVSVPEKDVMETGKRDEVSDAESSEGEIDLRMVKEVLTTIDLKMFEVTRKPKRRNKKKKKKEGVVDEAEELDDDDDAEDVQEDDKLLDHVAGSGSAEDEIYNNMYTACRTGNQKLLRNSLEDLRRHVAEKCSTEESATENLGDNQNQENITESKTCETVVEPGETSSGNTSENIHLSERSQQDRVSIQDSELGDNSSEQFLTILNRTFGKTKESLLHVTSRLGRVEMSMRLLEAGADPCVRNGNKLPPYAVTSSKEVRNVFRRFMAKYPDRYNYTLAQVPSPLTEEMEAERKARENEKKKAVRKAKQEKQKEVQAKEAEKLAEEKERERFLNLSEREKRALAADRRLVKETVEKTGTLPVLSRCWQCGTDITGRTPFEYYNYKFCSPKCLKTHRTQNQQKKS